MKLRVALVIALLAAWLGVAPAQPAKALSLCATQNCASITVSISGDGNGVVTDDQSPHQLDCDTAVKSICTASYSWAKLIPSIGITLTWTPAIHSDACDPHGCVQGSGAPTEYVALNPGDAVQLNGSFVPWYSMLVIGGLAGTAKGSLTDTLGQLHCAYSPGATPSPCATTYYWDYLGDAPAIGLTATPAATAIACIQQPSRVKDCGAAGQAASEPMAAVGDGMVQVIDVTFEAIATPVPSIRPTRAPTQHPPASGAGPGATMPPTAAPTPGVTTGAAGSPDASAGGGSTLGPGASSAPITDAPSATSSGSPPPVAALAFIGVAVILVIAAAFLLGRSGRARAG